jgi:ATP-binding cassette subfamily C (CFTR/MRP) protein 2
VENLSSLLAKSVHSGAGKSSLLAALLHEMRQISGEVYLHPSVAYAAQTPWIINATLTENITMGLPFEPQRFQTVIECCCLRPDLEILPGGRHCQIGEKGVSLSGGQKARISLARCLYRDAEVYLLDDPLSALDINVARQVFKHTILERLKEKTRILVTHHPYCLFHADRVIIMKNGSIVQQGTYTQLTAAGINVVSFLERCENEHLKDKQKRKENDKVTSEKDRCVDSDSNSDQSVSNGNEIKLIQDEERNTGRVNFTIYKSYFSKMGMIPFFSVVIFGICVQTSYILKDWWLGYWSSQRTGATGEQSFIPLSEFLMTYVAIALFGAATLLLQEIIFSLASVRAAKIIHFLMLDSVFRAPIRFFETTPVGRILNRFSKDQEAVDTVIPQTLLDLFMAAITVGSVLVLLCIATPLFTIFVIPLGILYHLIQNYYVKTSRELQRLDAVSSSPIYSHCAETLNGLPTIRAFRLQPHFVREIERRVDQNAKAFFLLNECNRWLGQRLEFCGTCVVCLTAFFAVICRNWMTDATMVGLALAYAGSITESLTWLVRYVTTTENQMNSVERMEYYIQNLEREAPAHIPECDPPNDWPQHGAIEFKNLVMKYRDDLEPALKGISFKINAGENVGICGRTGAGKSSVMYSLFRLQEATEGQILIDGIDISKIGLEPLRSNLIIIPQDPILFSGTVRSNLDPFNQYTDDELWRVLERVHMKDKIQSLPQKLYTVVAENGDNFSVGEKQLLCLGRALCRKTKIILMDEATAAIDLKTEQFIQQTIRDEFKKCTVITIAHRLNTIIENDKIIVMDNGRVLEMGTPKELLDNANSYFSAMVSKTGMETFFRQLVNAKTQLSQCQQQTPLQS